MLEAVKEYNVSGTSSSEDSAESDDLERLATTAEGTVWCQSAFPDQIFLLSFYSTKKRATRGWSPAQGWLLVPQWSEPTPWTRPQMPPGPKTPPPHPIIN